MSLYQLACAVEGWNRAQGGDTTPAPLTVAEYESDIAKAAERKAHRMNGNGHGR